MVKRIATAKIAYPELYEENSCLRWLATHTQKIITGTIISNKVTNRDLASGPNTNLPPHMNFCRKP